MNEPDARRWEVSHAAWRLAAAFATGVVGAVWFPINIGFVPISQRSMVAAVVVVAFYLVLLGYEVWAQRKRKGRLWRECLLRGLAISALSPLLLFASRPRDWRWRWMFSIFLVSVFVAWPVGLLTGEWHVAPWDTPFWLHLWRAAQWNAVFLSYLLFNWAGCAMAILPGRWPAYPHYGEGVRLSATGQRLAVCGVWVTVAAMIGLMVVLGVPWAPFFYLFFLVAVVPLPLAAMLFFLVPWPTWRFIPRLPELPVRRVMHPCAVILILSIWAAQLPLSENLRGYVLYVWTGRFFTSDDLMTGGALDQPSLQKAFFISAWFAVTAMAVIAATRWLSDRRSRFGYFAHAIPAALIGLVHLSAHTTPFGFTLKYLLVMGPTVKRIAGVFYGALGYLILIVFLIWALWPPPRREESGKGAP